MTSEPFDVAAWNLSRLAAPPDSAYERIENAISPAAYAWAWAEVAGEPVVARIIGKANIGDYGPAK